MAEYYPLLAKAVGSLPNSTLETRRVVYERARKALIGQLRTLHPPVPDDDIERESTALDRAIERIEGELAAPTSDLAVPPPAVQTAAPIPPSPPPATSGGALGPVETTAPKAALRTKMPAPKSIKPVVSKPATIASESAPPVGPAPALAAPPTQTTELKPIEPDVAQAEDVQPLKLPGGGKVRPDRQRPIAPQPASADATKRRRWVIPLAGIGIVMALVGIAAWTLRDRPQTVARTKTIEPQSQSDTGKIAERVGEPASSTGDAKPAETAVPATPRAPAPAGQTAATPAPGNPELPVAHRAALLVEAPDEPNKVKTYLGTVVWKLNNVSGGPNDAVGLAVEADIDLPDDKLSAVVTFEKNTDASLPASHTIKVRFTIQPGSATGDVKQISVPQLRREDSAAGEPLAGVTVPVIQNSFLVGLSPGNAESANLELLRGLQWIDIPMLLTSGKIAKLTFEKSDSGQRDLTEAAAAWQK